jgi:hypothetical protein
VGRRRPRQHGATPQAKRHAEACALAVDQAGAELLDLLNANRTEWATVLAEEIATARDGEAAALAAYSAAHSKRRDLEALVAFAERFPAERTDPQSRTEAGGTSKAASPSNTDPTQCRFLSPTHRTGSARM